MNAKHSVTLLRACHSANQHCSITSCTLLSRLQKSFYFKCMFKSFLAGLGRVKWRGEGGGGEQRMDRGREVQVLCFSFAVLQHGSKFASLRFLSYMRHWICWMSNNRRAISSKHVSGAVRMQASWRDTDEPSKTIPLSWHCDIQPSEYTIYREICKYAIFSQPPSWKHAHTRSPSRLIVPFKRQNENSISLCRQKMERERNAEREK